MTDTGGAKCGQSKQTNALAGRKAAKGTENVKSVSSITKQVNGSRIVLEKKAAR
jgi:hypothetical protein